MDENLIAKLDRLGAGAGIKQMTPELYSFALDVRKDLMDGWPKRPLIGLASEDRLCAKYMQEAPDGIESVIDYIEAKLKEKNNG